jgi:hypothetical protein
MENSIARGVVDWIKQNLETGEGEAPSPSSPATSDIPKLAISSAAE